MKYFKWSSWSETVEVKMLNETNVSKAVQLTNLKQNSLSKVVKVK